MKAVAWAKSYQLINTKNQQQLEEAIQSLTALEKLDDYTKEAFVKTFCEGIIFLESNLLYTNDIHPKKMNFTVAASNPPEYMRKYKEVEVSIESSINRQKRLYSRMINTL